MKSCRACVVVTSLSWVDNSLCGVSSLLFVPTLITHTSYVLFASPTEAKGTDKVDFECKSKTEDETTEFKDKIKFKISSDKKGLKVKVEYEEETEVKRRRLGRKLQDGTVEETEIETSYEVVFDKIVEYMNEVPAGGRRLQVEDEAYDFGVSTIVSEINLADDTFQFSDIDVKNRRLNEAVEGGAVYTFSACANEVACFDFTIAQADDVNADATANKMQIDVSLKDYPYAGKGTNIALMSSVESEREVDIEYADEESDDKKDKKDDEDEEDEEEEEPDEEEPEDTEEEPEDTEEDPEEDGGDNRRRRRLKKVRESSEVKVSFDDALETTGVRPFGEFTWATEAVVTKPTNDTVDETDEPELAVMSATTDSNTTETETVPIRVVATSDGARRLAFSFVGPSAKNAPDIFWDPETGVAYAEGGANGSTSGSTALGGGVALAIAAAMAMLAW